MSARLNLLVLRSTDAKRAVGFYEALGFTFLCHSHGNGPEHFVTEQPGLIFEIYPLAPDVLSTRSTRIGFQVDAMEAVLQQIRAVGGRVVSLPKDSPWGIRAVVEDFDGHRVELLASRQESISDSAAS